MTMKHAIVDLCKALSQLLSAYYMTFDRETSDLVRALAEYVEKNS